MEEITLTKPRILIINPNSDLEMTAAIDENAQAFAGDDLHVVTVHTPGASPFVATYEDQFNAAAGMVDIVRSNKDEYDAFVIACHADPNLDLMKEVCEKPVVGIAEASMKLATMLGHCFSVIGPVAKSSPNKKALADRYGLSRELASVRAADLEEGETLEERLTAAGKKAIELDGAEVLVLGCAAFAGLDKRMEQKLGVPVLDGVISALIIAAGLAKYNVKISKVRRYRSGNFSL